MLRLFSSLTLSSPFSHFQIDQKITLKNTKMVMLMVTKMMNKAVFGSFDMVIELLTQESCHTNVESAVAAIHASTSNVVNITG